MLVGMIVFLAVGFLCVALGLALWRKQKISLVQDYHTRNVKREDVPAYTRLMGFALLAIGAGCLLTGVLVFGFEVPAGWAAFPLGFAAGLALIHRAQKTYNGGWF